MSKQKIGFFSLYETEIQDSYVGTLLITDNYGIPLEFKCTHSVKATPIQKALYGERLQPYIGIELCGVPLMKSITNSPDFLFINHEYLMPIRKQVNTPVILVDRASTEDLTEEEAKEKAENILIVHDYSTYDPIEIQYHPDYKNDPIITLEGIKVVFNNFDLFEPFDRMRKSVEILGKSDSKFK